MKKILLIIFIAFIFGCSSGPKENVNPSVTSGEVLPIINGCGSTAECAVVVTSVAALYKISNAINGESEQKLQAHNAEAGQLVIKCYMKDEEAGFLYPCGTYQVFYKNKKLKDFKQLRSRGETTEIQRFPEVGDIKVQIDICNKTQELKDVKAGSVVHVQFSNVCKS